MTLSNISERLTYDVITAAKILGISRNSCYQGCLKGEIPHVKVGKRVLIAKIPFERWLSGNSEANNGKG